MPPSRITNQTLLRKNVFFTFSVMSRNCEERKVICWKSSLFTMFSFTLYFLNLKPNFLWYFGWHKSRLVCLCIICIVHWQKEWKTNHDDKCVRIEVVSNDFLLTFHFFFFWIYSNKGGIKDKRIYYVFTAILFCFNLVYCVKKSNLKACQKVEVLFIFLFLFSLNDNFYFGSFLLRIY